MPQDIISQKEAHQLERTVENRNNRAKEQRFFLSECMGAIGGGFLAGYAVTKNPDLMAFGPGDRLNIHHVMAAAGLFLGRRRTRMGAIARGAGLSALGQLGTSYGEKAAAES